MPEWVEKWICGYLAKMLGMERPANEPGFKFIKILKLI